MGIEIIQDGSEPNESGALISDAKGGRIAHLSDNARLLTTLNFKIDQTSPGIVQGLGANTNVTLPGGAIPVALRVFGKLNDSVTSASISVGMDNVTSQHFLSGYNVANAPTGSGQQLPSAALNLFAALPVMPMGQAHQVVGRYNQGASTSAGGGPWYVAIDYYLPDPA